MSDQKYGPSKATVGTIAIMAITAVFLLASHHSLAEEQKVSTENQGISVKELPLSIQEALGDVEVEEIEIETENGATTYEITIEEPGLEIVLELNEAGCLVGIEIEHEGDDDGEEDGDDDDDERNAGTES